jgi:hypothetical protein
VANVIIGARNEEQLRQNLGAVDWKLTAEQLALLDAASAVPLAYPYWPQRLQRAQSAAGVIVFCTSLVGVGIWKLAVPAVTGKRFTATHLGEIKNGMSYGQVVAIIGFEGNEAQRQRHNGGLGTWHLSRTVIWTNPDAPTCIFVDDQVVHIDSAGLRK